MRQKRVAISAVMFIVLLGALYAIGSWSRGPKPPPDVELEGRLAEQVMEESEAQSEKPEAPDAGEKDDAVKKTSPVTATTTLSDEEQSMTDGTDGSVVKLETAKGDIYLELYDGDTPVHVGNFLDLIDDGFYDGLAFHRVIPNFMVQGGCPNGDGSGGPGFTIPDEANKGLKHVRGALSMAKTAAPNTGGSQFFVCHSPQPHLNGVHTVFGECIDGMDVVDAIRMGDEIRTVTIIKKGDGADAAIADARAARVPE